MERREIRRFIKFLPLISPKAEKPTSEVVPSSDPWIELKVSGSDLDVDVDEGLVVAGTAVDAAAARFRRAATELEANFFPSVTLLGSYKLSSL